MIKNETLWTCVATCTTCGHELNKAEHVPESKKSWLSVSAPLQARGCPNGHDTLSDLNYNFDLKWTKEVIR